MSLRLLVCILASIVTTDRIEACLATTSIASGSTTRTIPIILIVAVIVNIQFNSDRSAAISRSAVTSTSQLRLLARKCVRFRQARRFPVYCNETLLFLLASSDKFKQACLNRSCGLNREKDQN